MTNEKTEPTWYLLFDGTSIDGMGPASYHGRTTDPTKAYLHKKNCDNNPYSVGYVVVVTEDQHRRVFCDAELEADPVRKAQAAVDDLRVALNRMNLEMKLECARIQKGFLANAKVNFETSKGIVTCTILQLEANGFASLKPDEKSKKILDELYIWAGLKLNKDGWVIVELDDGYYGCPEYKAQGAGLPPLPDHPSLPQEAQ